MENPNPDAAAPARRRAVPLPSTSVEPDLPVQNRRDWHPERLADDIDELEESHLIRGYD